MWAPCRCSRGPVGVTVPPEVALRSRRSKCQAAACSTAAPASQGCQMAKCDPFLSLDCARGGGCGGAIQGKEGIKFCSAV